MASQFVRDLAAVSGRRISRQAVYSRLADVRRPVWRIPLQLAGKTGYCGAENIGCRHHKNGGGSVEKYRHVQDDYLTRKLQSSTKVLPSLYEDDEDKHHWSKIPVVSKYAHINLCG
ncbi:hypothetical protein TNCV_5058841 [Trichonephila clavipes]|nr:hypothetical protein TNCV_5058841 [Trichonephila clavipes]